eukprot:CAMPEP_0170223362 /NCGR_PEP_ID=MMETSP0116_2-20130129/11380_1 /TAXON_ID=400756 /ORGANISM="Durinskia baltica, Strain CSIRO CS-38" /LENGTH=428 /DNA_ID=CAMNT_0010474063 /DNA_START=100 /DNA_END=1383 /DNA_ORIENTATION=+
MARRESDQDTTASSESFGLDDFKQGDQATGEVNYTTLRECGPQTSEGSKGHPEECTPCTFYCFAKRGCKRGEECKFCHMWHQSKLQLRREAWKSQQRLKRKEKHAGHDLLDRKDFESGDPADSGQGNSRPTITLTQLVDGNSEQRRNGGTNSNAHQLTYTPPVNNPVVANCSLSAQAQAFSPSTQVKKAGFGGTDFLATSPTASFDDARPALPMDQSIVCAQQHRMPMPEQGNATFTFPVNLSLAVGQRGETRPSIVGQVCRFRPASKLPYGVIVNLSNGVVSACCSQPLPRLAVVVEADFSAGFTLKASVDVEVIDFTVGGFFMAHLEEVMPGRFMVLLYKPQQEESVPVGMQQHSASQDVFRGDTSNKIVQDIPNIGSSGHGMGKCNPCAFVHKGGCQNGYECQFCHLCEPGEKRRRRKERRSLPE